MATALSNWTIDPVHSSVEFSLDYMGFSTYRTGFRALEGSLQFDVARPAASSVTASILVASVDVTNDRLMSRLMDPDLLGGKEHPTITFESTRVEAVDPAHWKVTGDLTIRDITKSVVLDVEFDGAQTDPWGGSRVGFSASTEIDREDWGLTWNQALETGGVVVGKKVTIEIEAETVRQA